MRRPIVAQRLDSPHSASSSDHHAREVMSDAVLFAILDGVKDAEVELLAIAAAYHDAGSPGDSAATSPQGAQIAAEAMRSAGVYTDQQIGLVEQMILDTKENVTREGVKQSPSTELSCYLLDADRAELGREEYVAKIHGAENSRSGASEDLALIDAYRRLCSHSWYSRAAFDLQERGKRRNVEKLEQAIRAKSATPSA